MRHEGQAGTKEDMQCFSSLVGNSGIARGCIPAAHKNIGGHINETGREDRRQTVIQIDNHLKHHPKHSNICNISVFLPFSACIAPSHKQ